MDADRNKARSGVNEDRMSGLPDELIHQILSRFDTKFTVQTCVLSSRWKFIWKSMPCLRFSCWEFETLPKFAKFVNHVLSHRNHQVEVSLVKLDFHGAASQAFVRKTANYVFSHNVQELSVYIAPKRGRDFPNCFFSSVTLKELSLRSHLGAPRVTPKTHWDFPALTTLHLSDIMLCDNYDESVDLFSKCVNLKNLVLKGVLLLVKEFHIITPGLLNLTVIDCIHSRVIHVIAPQLENLTVKGYRPDCTIVYMKAPLRLSSLCYSGHIPPPWFKNCFHALNEVSVSLSIHNKRIPYEEKEAREIINMLQELHGARCLTLNLDIVECISSFPDLLSHHPSPFSNLISLSIISNMRPDAYKINLSTEARNFLLENSPSATFIMDLPEPPPTITKAMKAKEAREKKAKLLADIQTHMNELQTLLEQENMLFIERKLAQEKTNTSLEHLMQELQMWINKKAIECETKRPQIEVVVSGLMAQISICLEEILDMAIQENDKAKVLFSKRAQIILLFSALTKRQISEMEACYSRRIVEVEKLCDLLHSASRDLSSYVKEKLEAFKNYKSDNHVLLASQPSSSSAVIPTQSSSSINPMP